MASNNVRLQTRSRLTGIQRPKVNGDENATSKHSRQLSGSGATRASMVLRGLKNEPQRPALGEVTTTAVNRKSAKSTGKDGLKDTDAGLKRSKSSTTTATSGAQRVPLGTSRTETSGLAQRARQSVGRVQKPSVFKRISRQEPAVAVVVPPAEPVREELEELEDEDSMVVEEEAASDPPVEAETSSDQEAEVEELVEAEEVEAIDEALEASLEKSPRMWPDVDTERVVRHTREIEKIKAHFQEEVDFFDTTMVSEYAEEIFEYMENLEEDIMPNPDYMDGQNEINWSMRQTLVDWLLQVHLRWHMLPETLWIAINIVDRFLTRRVVSLVKLQLVGVTAMFIAAKYEEILAPSVDEFVFMTENGFKREEILKGERIVLQTLDFKISQYCSPYSWMRRISKADDYDLHTRTLGKFLAEVTLLDHRFLRCKPSLIAAVSMYSARKMLGGKWNDAFVYHSGFVAEHLEQGHQWICEKLLEESFKEQHVCQKYAHKKFLKASIYAIDWARTHQTGPSDDTKLRK